MGDSQIRKTGNLFLDEPLTYTLSEHTIQERIFRAIPFCNAF